MFSWPNLTLYLSFQVRNFSAVTCATPPSLQRAAWKCTCASIQAPSPSNVPSVNSASEHQDTAKPTSSVTSVQTATAASPSGLPCWLVRPVRTQGQLRVRGSSRVIQRLFNLWVCYKQPTLTPAFTSLPTKSWQGSLTRICCSRGWWDRPSCRPRCQVGIMNLLIHVYSKKQKLLSDMHWTRPDNFQRDDMWECKCQYQLLRTFSRVFPASPAL